MKLNLSKQCLLLCFLLTLFLSRPIQAREMTQEEEEQNNNSLENKETNEIIPRLDTIFNDPFVVQTLNGGSQIINTTFDSLLVGVFYQLLNNKFSQKISDSIYTEQTLNRKVYTTGQGKYVIVDRFTMGPRYAHQFASVFQKMPLSLDIGSTIDMLSIYLRTDPQRSSVEKELSTWRYWVNNWFGLIPFLERMLPPSFDSNWLYDPIKQIETPFSFPNDRKAFEKMEVGSIQSYAFQGAVALPLSIDGGSGPFIRDALAKLKMDFSLPYTLFVQGEYRINVLKKSEQIAWVGLSKLKKGGHSLAGFIGSTIYLFTNSLGKFNWKGVPANFSPIDVSIAQSLADRFDQIYEFDLSKNASYEAYLDAIAGDFSKAKDQQSQEGIKFHFSQDAVSKAIEKNNDKNLLLLYRSSSGRTKTKSEIKINDEKGEFYVLENIGSHNERSSNVFSGEQSIELTNELDLNVEKQDNDEVLHKKTPFYRFHSSMKPYQLILKYQINDRMAHVKNFYDYLDMLKTFSNLTFDDVPKIPLITEKSLTRARRKAFFSFPSQQQASLHVTNTMLGKFNATALVIFDTNDLKSILEKTQEEKRNAFYSAYGRTYSDDLSPNLETMRSYLVHPLRIINWKSEHWDSLYEINHALKALAEITPQTEPLEMQNAIDSLFDTDYPLPLINALYLLSDLKKIPRNVSLYISPTKELEDEHQVALANLSKKSFRSEAKFPELERYRIAKNKLNAFVPTSLNQDETKIKIDSILIENNELIIRADTPSDYKLKIFIKISTKGRLILSQSYMGNATFEISPKYTKAGLTTYAIPLLTKDSPLIEVINQTDLENEVVYSFFVSIFNEQSGWSLESSANFLYNQGEFTAE